VSLLAAHCASPDCGVAAMVDRRSSMPAPPHESDLGSSAPAASSARDRLEQAVGAELAHKLVFALCAGHERHAA
jgi:hypothetical protein